MLEIVEFHSSTYRPRTKHNADAADITIALAEDYTTAGERLTRNVAGDTRYLPLPIRRKSIESARDLYRQLRERGLHNPIINVAGNGIYTLKYYDWTQSKVNRYLYRVLVRVHEHWPIKKVVSGGQTGVDIAGIVAATALGIDATATLPKGYVQRDIDGNDKPHTKTQILAQITNGVAFLNARLKHRT